MSPSRVLVVDDEKNITFVVRTILERGGFEVDTLNSASVAKQWVQGSELSKYSTILTDLYMPGINGMELLELIQAVRPDLPVVLMTAYGTIESAVQALKSGAFDYITKPFEQGEILSIVSKAVNTFNLRKKEPDEDCVAESSLPALLVGKSQQMQEVHRIIKKVAASPATILICGESGTGKELVAAEIHRRSDRAEKPFIKINCAAIPQNLIESELFGYERGAFTGANNSKPGRFELANNGTLFLDEVAEMPQEMQVKLLRAIQECEFERVGGLQTIKIDVRLIAATNKDLSKEVREGRFREDLYYRLKVIPIDLRPLRERRGDIEDLIYYFVKKYNVRFTKKIETVDQLCIQRLIAYGWPGNVRQLEHVIERAVVMSESNILRLEDLPTEILENAEGLTTNVEGGVVGSNGEGRAVRDYREGEAFKDIVRRQTQAVEREIIGEVLNEHQGNVTKTAEKLGLSRKGLQLKLKDLGLSSR